MSKKIFCLLFLSLLVSCIQREYHVKNVIDGDTIELSDGSIVRYIGIDTPETMIKQEDGTWFHQPDIHGEAAKEFNRKLVENKNVRLEYDMVQKDKHNRILAYVFVENTFVNAELIKEGHALLYTIPPNVRYVESFIRLQREARENRCGLWGDVDDKPISPEDARNFVGHVKYVKGKVINISETKSTIILNFTAEKNGFRAIIFKNNLPIFTNNGVSPVKDCLNRQAKICGKIKMYKGLPEIIVDVPDQIELIKKEEL